MVGELIRWKANDRKMIKSEIEIRDKHKEGVSTTKTDCVKGNGGKFMEGGGQMDEYEWRRVKIKIKTIAASVSIYVVK